MPVWQQDRTHRNLGHCTPRYVLELDSKNTISLGRLWGPGSTVMYSGSLHALCTAEASTALGSSGSLHPLVSAGARHDTSHRKQGSSRDQDSTCPFSASLHSLLGTGTGQNT